MEKHPHEMPPKKEFETRLEFPDPADRGFVGALHVAAMSMFTAPARFIREKFVTPYQQDYPWYHRRYKRVPTIAECFEDDWICRQEAEMQHYRYLICATWSPV